MNTLSRMRTTMARRICLLVFLCLSAGCWDSHPKQEANDRSEPKAVDSASAEKPAALPRPKAPDELGFKHTWKPKEVPPETPSVAKPAAPAVAVRPSPSDDRYGESTPAPAVGGQADSADTPAYNPRPLEPKTPSAEHRPEPKADLPKTMEPGRHLAADPAKTAPVTIVPARVEPVAPAVTGGAPSTGNPLRDPGAATAPGRPEAPPPPPEPVAGPSLLGPPDKPLPPVALGPPAGQNSEIVIQTKPDETITERPPVPLKPAAPVAPAVVSVVPAAPVAPVVEKKAEPKEHRPETVRPGPRTNKNSGVPFDPIAVNGKIFVDRDAGDAPWPKPKLALVITGNQEGYLEPCGCAGLDRMKGGMSRRNSLFRQLRADGWPVVGLDVGGIAKGFGKQAELKFQIAINAMNEMRYNTVALGMTDLHLPTTDVMSLTMPANASSKTMFVSGNVGLLDFDETRLPRTHLINAGFKTIGVTSVLGKTFVNQLAGNTDLKTIAPETLLDAAVPRLKARANYLILLAHSTRDEAIELGKKYPAFDLVVCSDGGPERRAEPPAQPEEINKGGTKLIEVGEKGMYAVVLGMYDDPQKPLRYQRVTLDSRFPSSPQMVALMGAYQDQLKELGLEGLGIHPLPNPLKISNGDYAGTDSCKNCHEESYRVWKKSPHSHAFATLQKAVPPRNFDPECISCHTVGWNPAKFFPYESGYLSEKATPQLINVGCEDCHGPGQKHVDAENRGTKEQQDLYRKACVNTKEEMANPNSHKQNCWSCHDLDNSPEFKFDLYWPYVKHYEHE